MMDGVLLYTVSNILQRGESVQVKRVVGYPSVS